VQLLLVGLQKQPVELITVYYPTGQQRGPTALIPTNKKEISTKNNKNLLFVNIFYEKTNY